MIEENTDKLREKGCLTISPAAAFKADVLKQL